METQWKRDNNNVDSARLYTHAWAYHKNPTDDDDDDDDNVEFNIVRFRADIVIRGKPYRFLPSYFTTTGVFPSCLWHGCDATASKNDS